MTWVLLTWPIHLRHRHDSCLVSRDHLSVLPLMLLLLLPFLILPFLFLPESLFLSNTFVNTLQHMSAHTYTHPLPLPLSFPLPLSLPVSFFIMHFLKWAKYGAGAKHQAMMMWKLTSFRGVRRLVGESKAKQHDLITDPMHVDAVQYVPRLILSWASVFFFVFLSLRNSPFTFQAPLQSARLPCWQLPGHINRIPEARSTERQRSERGTGGENRMISFGKGACVSV